MLASRAERRRALDMQLINPHACVGIPDDQSSLIVRSCQPIFTHVSRPLDISVASLGIVVGNPLRLPFDSALGERPHFQLVVISEPKFVASHQHLCPAVVQREGCKIGIGNRTVPQRFTFLKIAQRQPCPTSRTLCGAPGRNSRPRHSDRCPTRTARPVSQKTLSSAATGSTSDVRWTWGPGSGSIFHSSVPTIDTILADLASARNSRGPALVGGGLPIPGVVDAPVPPGTGVNGLDIFGLNGLEAALAASLVACALSAALSRSSGTSINPPSAVCKVTLPSARTHKLGLDRKRTRTVGPFADLLPRQRRQQHEPQNDRQDPRARHAGSHPNSVPPS